MSSGAPPAYSSGSNANEDSRPLPNGWIKQHDSNYNRHFYVDTKANPPKSIWVHPLDDPDYQRSQGSSQGNSYAPPPGPPGQSGQGQRFFGLGGNSGGQQYQGGPQQGYQSGPQGYGGNYGPGPYNQGPGYGQQQPYYQPQQQYVQQQKPSRFGGAGMGTGLALGGGLLGGMLIGDMISDHDRFEQQQAYDQGYDNGQMDQNDFGNGGFDDGGGFDGGF